MKTKPTKPPPHPANSRVGRWTLDVPHRPSLQADRFSRGIAEQRTSRFLDEMRSKGSLGTEVMPVLSQMIRARDALDSADLCLALKTPGFSYHSLRISDQEGGNRFRQENHAASGASCKRRSYAPVSLADPLELRADETSEERTHAAVADKRLGHTGQPHVDVVGRAVQLQEPAGQVGVIQDLAQFLQVPRLGQAAEPAPGVVSLVTGRRGELR